jgi:Tol biopolymer transport system component
MGEPYPPGDHGSPLDDGELPRRLRPAPARSNGEPAGTLPADDHLSPSGDVVSFVAARGGRADLVVVPAVGGPEVVLTTAPAPCSARALGGGVTSWLPDGSGIVYAAVDGNLWLAPVAGGPPRQLTHQRADRAARAPVVSPDGQRVAFVVDDREVGVVGLGPDAGWPVLVSGQADFAFDPSWSADGDFLAWHEWDVPAMPWDESRWVVCPADGNG